MEPRWLAFRESMSDSNSSHCFLCLKPESNFTFFGTSSTTSTTALVLVYFRNLCKHLGFETETADVLSRVASGTAKTTKDALVFCAGCSGALELFSELFQQREVIDMRLKHSLETIRGIISAGDDKQEGPPTEARNVTKPNFLLSDDDGDRTELIKLRRGILAKCTSPPQRRNCCCKQPEVRLRKLQLTGTPSNPETDTANFHNDRAKSPAAGLHNNQDETHSSAHQWFTCDVCNKTFRFRRRYLEHKKVAHSQSSRTVNPTSGNAQESSLFQSEDIPSASVDIKEELESIVNDLHGESQLETVSGFVRFVEQEDEVPIPLICQKCGKGFPTERELSVHNMIGNCGPNLFKCNLCGRGYNFQADLSRHQKLFHCDLPGCPRVYRCVEQVLAHKKKVHPSNIGSSPKKSPETKVKTYRGARRAKTPCNKCDICDQTFVGREALTEHRKMAHMISTKLFICESPGCKKGFLDMKLLQHHRVTEHQNPRKIFVQVKRKGTAGSLPEQMHDHAIEISQIFCG